MAASETQDTWQCECPEPSLTCTVRPMSSGCGNATLTVSEPSCPPGVSRQGAKPDTTDKDEEAEHSKFLQDIALRAWPRGVELYVSQRETHWPRTGNHILAHFDDSSIIVYQAFHPDIAQYAVKHQRFGGDKFSFDRMSWIKTNFLWMMYRCGWATKVNQERVLAVRITQDGFNQILASAFTAQLQKSKNLQTTDIEVRLQWDPDHDTSGSKETRRAIQLGLKQQVLRKYATEWLLSITDVTPFVRQQRGVLEKKGQREFVMPCERVYIPASSDVCEQIGLETFITKCFP